MNEYSFGMKRGRSGMSSVFARAGTHSLPSSVLSKIQARRLFEVRARWYRSTTST